MILQKLHYVAFAKLTHREFKHPPHRGLIFGFRHVYFAYFISFGFSVPYIQKCYPDESGRNCLYFWHHVLLYEIFM